MPHHFLAPKEFVSTPAASERSYRLEEALAYTRWLATTHYENFHLVTFLLPARLHQDFYNLYAYCRWADDLGDEMDSPQESLRLLEWWRSQLDALYEGRAEHPVFIALRQTVARHRLPKEPFADLLRAFIQDQTVSRYRDFESLFAYCRCSANPVGRLVLQLCGYSDSERLALSDATCTALQLANFWQDVAADWRKGRVYIPLELLERHGGSVDDIRDARPTPGFRAAVREAVGVTRELFLKGLPLARMVDRRLALDIELFSRGGMRVLDRIERQGYDVLSRRPSISRVERAALLLGGLARVALRTAA